MPNSSAVSSTMQGVVHASSSVTLVMLVRLRAFTMHHEEAVSKVARSAYFHAGCRHSRRQAPGKNRPASRRYAMPVCRNGKPAFWSASAVAVEPADSFAYMRRIGSTSAGARTDSYPSF